MKLPNGYGSVSKLSGNRRRPFIVRYQKQILGYVTSREEGLALLADYHSDPWDITKKKATFTEIYNLLIEKKSISLSQSTIRKYKSCYKNYCEPLYNEPYSDLRTYHFTSIIEVPGLSGNTQVQLRKFFRAMDKIAYEYDIIKKKYSESIPTYHQEVQREKVPFSEEEIKLLWNNLNVVEDADLVLIQIYTGMRSGELEKLLVENINLESGTLRGGIKTAAGKNRIIPIHSKILPLVERRVKDARKETFLNYGSKQYRIRFKKVMEKLNMSHIPHECRHTLRTRLDNLNINSNIINLILGHQGVGVGERVYTHKTIQQLKDAIELLN